VLKSTNEIIFLRRIKEMIKQYNIYSSLLNIICVTYFFDVNNNDL